MDNQQRSPITPSTGALIEPVFLRVCNILTSHIAKLCLSLIVGLTALVTGSYAADTEIYQATYNSTAAGRPKVLIAFDDSGSMDTIVPGQRPPYSQAASYVAVHAIERLYISSDGDPPSKDSSDYTKASKFRCAEATVGLTSQGFFQSAGARRWASGAGKWKSLKKNDGSYPGNPAHVECKEDVINANSSNISVADGYPLHQVPNGQEYDGVNPEDSNVPWGNQAYTFYSAHYMDYLYDETLEVDRTRMAIAQDVITSLITANTGIDFGLLEFNANWEGYTNHGGRIVHRIISNMTAEQRGNVVDMVNTMTARGSTPLCESTYEAYRYLKGDTVQWGDDKDEYGGDIVPRDLNAEAPAGTYDSPATDCAYTYVIVMTDGFPQNDTGANAAIETLTGKTCETYASSGQGDTKNCMPELARYMANNDLDNDTTNGSQYGITYTVGFTTDQDLLRDTAEAGKGQYYTANSADALTNAFQGAILSILSSDSTFTSPAVAVDTFTRTRSRNDVFYAMFKPNEGVNWSGNVKKLNLSLADDSAVLVDKNGDAAVNPATGNFKETASTYWSTSDGGSVEEGGVGALLAARDLSGRTIWSNTGTAQGLEAFNSANMTRDAFGYTTDLELFDTFDVANQSELDAELGAARGFDLNTDGTVSSESREWIMGDVMHSQPLVISYGARTGFTNADPDLRFIVGTNSGFLHMFGNDNGQEDWAFFPKELAPILRERRLDALSGDHVYGIDLPPIKYTKDINEDGTIDYAGGDKVWAFLGLRRGGQRMYALDISNPDVPSFMWRLDQASSGFSELGQTWSVPVVTHIPGYRDAYGVPKPVVVIGAGYDVNKDDIGLSTADSIGRGLFIIDAATGALVWSVTPAPNSATNLQELGLTDSVPGQVTALDSNGDELTDRLYFADARGQLWRVDLSDDQFPTSTQDSWKIIKMADLNGATAATDRRFFNAPDVVRVRIDGKAIDVVLIGSGDRSNPNATDVENRFYMIRDEQTTPYISSQPTSVDCAATPPLDDFRCHLPLSDSDLFDISSNVLNEGTDNEKDIASTALAAANGWRLDLASSGEKSLSKSLTINGKVFFTTFVPNGVLTNINICEPQPGSGILNVISLLTGNPKQISLGPILPETPSVHFGEDGQIRLLLPPGAPPEDDSDDEECEDGVCELGEKISAPYGTYWYQEEY
jgi:type IV pilus assembly protein PilY1